MGEDREATLPDPKAWANEALSLFQRSTLPNKDWPRFRDEYICRQISSLADARQRFVTRSWAVR